MRLATKEKEKEIEFSLSNTKELYNYLNSLPPNPSFSSLFLFLNSLKYSSFSWAELLNKKEFTFSTYDYIDFINLYNFLKDLKKFGFRDDFSIKNGVAHISLSLNISESEKQKLQNLINQSKTPFSSFSLYSPNLFLQENLSQGKPVTTADKTLVVPKNKRVKEKQENQKIKKEDDNTPILLLDNNTVVVLNKDEYNKFPADNTAVVPKYSPAIKIDEETGEIKFINLKTKEGTTLDDLASLGISFFVDLDALKNILEGKGNFYDYASSGIDLVSFIGFGFILKGIKKSVTYAKKLGKIVNSPELREAFSKLPKNLRPLVLSFEDNLDLFIKNPKDIEKLLFNNCVKVDGKKAKKLLENCELKDGLLFKKDKLVGFIVDGEVYKLNKAILFPRLVFGGINIGYTVSIVEKVLKGDFEGFRDDIKSYARILLFFHAFGYGPEIVNKIIKEGLAHLKANKSVEKSLSFICEKFKIKDKPVVETLSSFFKSMQNLAQKYGYEKVQYALSNLFIVGGPLLIEFGINKIYEAANGKIPRLRISTSKADLYSEFSTSFGLDLSYLNSLSDQERQAYIHILEKIFKVKVVVEDGQVVLNFPPLKDFNPPAKYPSIPPEKFWANVFKKAKSNNSTQLSFIEKAIIAFEEELNSPASATSATSRTTQPIPNKQEKTIIQKTDNYSAILFPLPIQFQNVNDQSLSDYSIFKLSSISILEGLGILGVSIVTTNYGTKYLLLKLPPHANYKDILGKLSSIKFSQDEYKNFISFRDRIIREVLRQDIEKGLDDFKPSNYSNFKDLKKAFEEKFGIYKSLKEGNPLAGIFKYLEDLEKNPTLNDRQRIDAVIRNYSKFKNPILSKVSNLSFNDKILSELNSEKFVNHLKKVKVKFPKDFIKSIPEEEKVFFKHIKEMNKTLGWKKFAKGPLWLALFPFVFEFITEIYLYTRNTGSSAVEWLFPISVESKKEAEPSSTNYKENYAIAGEQKFSNFSEASKSYYSYLKEGKIGYSEFVNLLSAYLNQQPYDVGNGKIMFFSQEQKVKNTTHFSQNSVSVSIPKDYPVGVKFSKANVEVRFDNGKVYWGVGTQNSAENLICTYNNQKEISTVSVGFSIDETNKKVIVYLNSPDLGIINLQKEFSLEENLLKEIKNSNVNLVQWILLPKP